MLIDSHCHLDRLDLNKYQGDLSLALQAAKEQGVEGFLCVGIDLEQIPQLLAIAEAYKNVRITVGLHPTEEVVDEPTIEQLIALASHPLVVGVGETGLDYYRCEGEVEWQRQRFRNHIAAAKAVKKPIIIHTRQAQQDTIRIMQEENASEVGGVMHCFTETWEMAEQALAQGFYISFSGIITFKNAVEIQEVVKKVPLERILIETDSPYLAPNPYRGKSNEPAYVRYVAEAIAALKNVAYEKVAAQTTENFRRLFRVF